VTETDPAAGDGEAPPVAAFDRRMLEALVCPVTRGPLSWDAERQELVSRAAHLAYPVREGIPIMLPSEARETD
jgi:uncharacterized protein YbaR (Trm112 family)